MKEPVLETKRFILRPLTVEDAQDVFTWTSDETVTERMIKYVYENFRARDFFSEHTIDNPVSGRVMEKCGLKFSHYDKYSKTDGSQTFKSKVYKMHLE